MNLGSKSRLLRCDHASGRFGRLFLTLCPCPSEMCSPLQLQCGEMSSEPSGANNMPGLTANHQDSPGPESEPATRYAIHGLQI